MGDVSGLSIGLNKGATGWGNTNLDDTRGDGGDADAESGVECGERADEAVDAVFGCVVEGAGEGGHLACYAGNVDD